MSQVVGHFGALREGKSCVTSCWVHGRRVLDLALGQWHAVEPEIDQYAAVSPYSYVGGDPVNRNDLTGRSWDAWMGNDPWAGSGDFRIFNDTDAGREMFSFKDGVRTRIFDSSDALEVEVDIIKRYADGTVTRQRVGQARAKDIVDAGVKEIDNRLREEFLQGNSLSDFAEATKGTEYGKSQIDSYLTKLVSSIKSGASDLPGLTGNKKLQLGLAGTEHNRPAWTDRKSSGIEVFYSEAYIISDKFFDNPYNIISAAHHEKYHLINYDRFLNTRNGEDYSRLHLNAYLYEGRHGAEFLANASEKYRETYRKAVVRELNYGYFDDPPSNIVSSFNTILKTAGIPSLQRVSGPYGPRIGEIK